MENEKSGDSNYKHKSGYTKRKWKLDRELKAAKTNLKQSKLKFSSKISDSFIKDDQHNEDKIETDHSFTKYIVSSNLHLDNGQDIINSPSKNDALKLSIETDDDFSQSKFLINSPSKNAVKHSSEEKTHILDNKLGLELFMTPSPKSTTQIKLTFLDQHLVHPTKHDEHCRSHEFAVQTFTQIKLEDRGDIVDIFDSSRRKIVANNREVLSRIINIIRFLAKQNLAFRGKRNESLYDLDIANKSNLSKKNRGNFMELVKLISKYDPILRRGNMVTFLSKNMYNKTIDIMRKSIQDKMCEEVKLAKFFSLEVDSAQDVTGVFQSKVIIQKLQDIGIDLNNLVSCSFDEAANMMGKYNRLKAHLQKHIPNAVFTHCQAHVLNFVIVDTTKCCLDAQNLFSLLQKNQSLWKNLLANKLENEKLRRIQLIGDTRWNSKDTALQAICHSVNEDHNKRERYVILLEVLYALGYDSNVNSDTSSEARDLLNKWCSFNTLVTAFLFLKIFNLSTPVSKYLQTKGLDYLAAWSLIKTFQNNLKEISNNNYFKTIISEVTLFVEVMEKKILDHLQNLEIEVEFPLRRRKRIKIMPGEKTFNEIGNLDENSKYRVQTFRVIMDKILEAVDSRFINNCNTNELRSFASCYLKLMSALNLKSHANLKQVDEDINNDHETGCVPRRIDCSSVEYVTAAVIWRVLALGERNVILYRML
ncbi:hypothetical protein QTP88_002228 [Uroleucon formosanum]